MQPRQFSILELMWWITATAVFLGIGKEISPVDAVGDIVFGVIVFVAFWVLSVVVLRAFFGLLVPVVFSSALHGNRRSIRFSDRLREGAR